MFMGGDTYTSHVWTCQDSSDSNGYVLPPYDGRAYQIESTFWKSVLALSRVDHASVEVVRRFDAC